MSNDRRRLWEVLSMIILSVACRIGSKRLICTVFVLLFTILVWPQESKTHAKWDTDRFGNHRFVLRVGEKTDAVWAHIEWRRRDHHPELKNVLVVDGQTGLPISNLVRANVTPEAGDLLFQPVSGPGEYYVYYLPYIGEPNASYPKISYPGPQETADPAWLSRNDAADSTKLMGRRADFPRAVVVGYESADDFDRFTEMERIASKDEISRLLAEHTEQPYFVFPEDRAHPIRMVSDIPQVWAQRGPGTAFRGTARPGEYYIFQLGVWAARAALSDLRVSFTDLRDKASEIISSRAIRCLNQGGVDQKGKAFVRQIDVPSGTVQALWCEADVATKTKPGVYAGEVTVSALGVPKTRLEFTLQISGPVIKDHGVDDPQRLARLHWLNSTLDQDDGIVPPYAPIIVHQDSLDILGRKLTLASDGFPRSIQSFFDISMTGIKKTGRELLANPIALVIEDADGHVIPWKTSGLQFVKEDAGRVGWKSTNSAGPLAIEVRGQLEFDGYVDYSVAVRARAAASLNDIRLEIPFNESVARYSMGLGLKGGTRPEIFAWKWNVKQNQDSAWIGDVNAGLQFGLQDDHYVRPLNTNFYLSQPLVMPKSWDNEGQGGCHFRSHASAYRVVCFSGARTMAANEVQHFDFHLLITPFHPILPAKQWRTRFYHAFKPVEVVAAAGANTINVHHGTAINPFINYPFLRSDEMKAYVDEAHAHGMKVKIYYTIRELSNHAPEMFALRSLGDEIIADGPGKGGPWLQEHLEDQYITGWHVPEFADSAVVTTGISRWHNFYVEGLRWLVDHTGIDGLYLDDVAFDRVTMKRVRKVLARGRPDPMIDLHSANQFDAHDGFASSANLYLEHFPYIDRLWFGEYFDYNSPPDYWLIEMSGIPFGLMGEMLQDGGNPWRGMVFGMTDRLPYSGDPRPLWRLWDSFGIQNTKMIGYWVPSSPVKTHRADVLATVYEGKRRALVAIASWSPTPEETTLTIDWKGLGVEPARAKIYATAIENFQDAAVFSIGRSILINPGKGRLLVIEELPSSGTSSTRVQ